MEDGVLLWLGSDGVTNGYSPALRAQRWELTGEPISEIMTNALDGKATLMSADDPELMAFTSTGRDVACFSPYYGMKYSSIIISKVFSAQQKRASLPSLQRKLALS